VCQNNHGKEYSVANVTKQLVDTQTNERVRPPIISTKSKNNITSFQPQGI